MKNLTRNSLLASASAAVLMTSVPAFAEEADDGQASWVNDAIIVTARRREESILKVPVVATVLAGEELARSGVADLGAIATRVPGLNIGSGVSSFGNQVSLRGIGTSTMNSTIDQSVSLNIDGMQFTQGLAYALGFFDMGQVEVLKGPQALFFGKASPAGVISIRSADPTDELEVIARAGYEFEAREYKGELIASGPISESLKARFAVSYAEGDGFFRSNGVPGNLGTLATLNPALAPFAGAYGPLGSFGGAPVDQKRQPATENLMLRGTLLFDAGDGLTARLKVNHSNQRMEGPGFDAQMASCPDGTAPSSRINVRFLSPNEDCKLDRNNPIINVNPADFFGVFNEGVPFAKIKQTFGTLDLNYRISDSLTLSSLTGLATLKQSSATNGSGSSFAGPPLVVQGRYKRDDFTQELRLTSDNTGPLNYMLGGFYHSGTQNFFIDLPANRQLSQLLGFLGALDQATNPTNPNFNPALFPTILANPRGFPAFPPTLSQGNHRIKVESLALFGQELYKLAPELELGVGARWTDDTRTHRQTVLFPAPSVTALAVPKISGSNISPELSLTYTPTDDLTLFASFKQAYKAGSFISSGVFAPGENISFKDERVRGGEVGIKSLLANGDLNVNLAGYYYKYKDLQVGSNELSPAGNITIYTRNAAGAKSYGIDFDLRYSPASVEGLTVSGAVSWNKSTFTDFDDAPCWGGQTVAQGCNLNPRASANGGLGGYTAQDLSGSPLVRAPKWAINANIDYELPVGGGNNLAIGLGAFYNSRYLTNILGRNDMYQGGYAKLNANLALRGKDDRWEVALIGNNLTNRIVTGQCTNASLQDGMSRIQGSVTGRGDATYPTIANPAGSEELLCTADPGRSVQVRLTFKL